MKTSKIIFNFLFIFLLYLSESKCILEIPLKSIRNKNVDEYKDFNMIKQGKNIVSNNFLFFYEEGNAYISQNLLFLATIKIGSNSQIFNLLLDTGSQMLWVAKKGCEGKNNIINFFDPLTSYTSQDTNKNFSSYYGSAFVEGSYYNDYIEYLPNQKFIFNFGVAQSVYSEARADGIIGLSKHYDDEQTSFIHMLKKSNNLDSLAFSIKFENNSFQSGEKGIMYIGGEHDDFSKNETISCPLVKYYDESVWACKIDSFSLKGSKNKATSNYETNIIFDTGTNHIVLPYKYLEDIKDKLNDFGCVVQNVDETYSIICDAKKDIPDLEFTINGKELIIPYQNLFYYTNSSKTHFGSLIVFRDSSINLIGSPFFYTYHTLFDNEKNLLKFYPVNSAIRPVEPVNPIIPNISNEKGLSTLEIIFIIIGCIIILGISIFIIIYYFFIKKKNVNIDNLLEEEDKDDDGIIFNEENT